MFESDCDSLTDDALTGGFRVYQRRRGHRYSLDDVFTAYRALQHAVRPQRYLDLGCGIGSVLLMVAYHCPAARCVGIEAQSQSLALARRNVDRNQLAERVQLLSGDLREAEVQAAAGSPFDLVTGTPPYQPLGAGTVSPDPQRAHARVELRGGVEAYLQAASALVAVEGRVVLCADARHPQRVWQGAAQVGLHVHRSCAVRPSAAKAPLFTVWELGLLPPTSGAEVVPEFVARDSGGQRTSAYRAVRSFFDLSESGAEPASPPLRPRQSRPTAAANAEPTAMQSLATRGRP